MFALARITARKGARVFSTAAAAEASPPSLDAGTYAVVGACYVGAAVWVAKDGVFTKMFGGEVKKAEVTQAKDQLTAIEQDLADVKAAVERGAITAALASKYKA